MFLLFTYNMNYIQLINLFWQTRREVRITSVEADLYFFLLQESNNRDWENPFECPNGLICVTIGVTEKTMIEARNRLQQKGLIKFESGKRKTKSPVYTILNCNIYSKNDSKKVSKNRNNIYINKTETKTKESNTDVLQKKEEFDYSFLDSRFKEVFFDWLEYKKSRNQKYKSQYSLETCYKNLLKLSDNSPDKAREVVNQSIANNWSGLFNLKNISGHPVTEQLKNKTYEQF